MPAIFRKARDPISSYSHLLGAAFSIIGLVLMIIRFSVLHDAAAITIISCIMFCVSLIALYSASGIYHFSHSSEHVLLMLRKLDHAMIYVLIAGSYTPILLTLLPQPKGLIFTCVIWSVAIVGILMKMCWMSAPRWLGTSIYILMGWAIAIDLPALTQLSPPAFALLLTGGISYTVGGIIYLFKFPNFSHSFGFHELFHIFVIIGSLCHYLMVFFYIA